jgi:hypothetical protein
MKVDFSDDNQMIPMLVDEEIVALKGTTQIYSNIKEAAYAEPPLNMQTLQLFIDSFTNLDNKLAFQQ